MNELRKLSFFFLSIVTICCVGRNNNAAAKTVEAEIQNLMRLVLKQNVRQSMIDVWSTLISDGNVYAGFDLEKHKATLDKIRETGLFAVEFIENYNQIVLVYDKWLRSKEFEWFVGESIPFFPLTNGGVNGWCNCQDVPYDEPCPWDNVEVKIISLINDNAEAIWKWGRLDVNAHPSFKEFSYNFRAVKEDGKWKISYLEVFDFEKATQQFP